MEASKTQSEQIPVEKVKEIAKEFPENNSARNDSENIEARDRVTSPQERWREVAQKVQHEQDPARMIALVQKLIATFEEEQLLKDLPPTRNVRNHSDSSET